MLRYYSLRRHLHEVFGEPVAKICVDAGFTCPNRDGTKGYGGCIYCNDRGSGAPYIKKQLSWEEQFEQSTRIIEKRNPVSKFIIYFQAFSNTYAPVDYLKKLYKTALGKKGVVGLSIGTRPDCASPEILDLIAELSKKTYLWLEYGAESIHEKTLQLVNRQHTFQDFLDAYWAAKDRGIRMCVHIVNGLPGESVDDILLTAKTIGQLEPDGIKMHSLYIERGTSLYNLYRKNPWRLFTEGEYSEIAAHCLEYMPETTVIHRLTGEAIPERLFAPEWSKNKQRILKAINDKLCEWNSRQGVKFERVNKIKHAEGVRLVSSVIC